MDVLFVGAGPASLAGAIRLKQLLNQKGRSESVVVIEKAEKIGQHNLSGALFEAWVLDDLIPEWRQRQDPFVVKMLANRVNADDIFFLPGRRFAIKLPRLAVPSYLHNRGNHIVSVSEMTNWLADIAKGLGVEIYNGFAAREIVVESNSVKGVRLGEKGLDRQGNKQPNYLPGEVMEAKVTVFGEGSLGQLSEEMVRRFDLGRSKNPQVRSLGVKEIIKLPAENSFGPNRAIHTVGFPNRADVFGGGSIYSMGDNQVAVALIMALDWRYCDLDPQRELQIFKSHRLIQRLLKGGEVVAYGARTLPEGGYYSLPGLVADNSLIIGDAAGLTDVRKLKGLHYAIKSGILAAEAIFRAIEKGDFTCDTLRQYEDMLAKSFVMEGLHKARNYRQVFARAGRVGLYAGAPLSLIQQAIPFRLKMKEDYEGMRRVRLNRKYKGGIDRPTAVSFSGTRHREDQPSHISFLEKGKCNRCGEDYGCHPCIFFCPAEVYKLEGDEVMLSPSNCVHCQTCRTKCPNQIIQWRVPEGGGGPRYRMM